jgi:hypothetical protein
MRPLFAVNLASDFLDPELSVFMQRLRVQGVAGELGRAEIANRQNGEDSCKDSFRFDRYNSSGFRRAQRAAMQ